MGGFLSNFSSSFLIALLAWPFVAAVLTLPILVLQYHRYNKIQWRRAIAIYLFILYGLGLVSFTLYPMPDNPDIFCRDHLLSPQLQPLNLIHDITTDGTRAILQVVMNILFFIPLGVFARLLFRWKFIPTVTIALLTSLCIETAQLTGVFHLYPCSYRLFDIDDLLLNTLGALSGYIVALLIPRKELEYAEEDAYVTNAGAIRRLAGFSVDVILTSAATLSITIPIYLLNKQLALDLQPTIYIIMIAIIHFALPYLSAGKSIGSRLTRMSLDNKARTGTRRFLYYFLRLMIIGAFLVAPYGIPGLIALVTILFWIARKRPIYSIL